MRNEPEDFPHPYTRDLPLNVLNDAFEETWIRLSAHLRFVTAETLTIF